MPGGRVVVITVQSHRAIVRTVLSSLPRSSGLRPLDPGDDLVDAALGPVRAQVRDRRLAVVVRSRNLLELAARPACGEARHQGLRVGFQGADVALARRARAAEGVGVELGADLGAGVARDRPSELGVD